MSDAKADLSPDISVVLPCYNEATILPGFISSLVEQMQEVDVAYEVVAIDDGSSDGTDVVLDNLTAKFPQLRVLHFSRNFGHMAALTAGLVHARATGAVISMDSDGQHPPEMIPELVSRWKNGADIVQTVRRETSDASFGKRITSFLFYYLLNKMGDTPVVSGAADFRLMSRQAVDALNALPEKARFVRGLVFWIGFKMEFVEFDAPARLGGKSKYNLRKMLLSAFDGITSFSTALLRFSVWSGVVAILTSVCYGVYIMYLYLFNESKLVTGWSSLMLMIMFLGGLNLLALGILGEYIGRIYSEVKNRPVYLLRNNNKNV